MKYLQRLFKRQSPASPGQILVDLLHLSIRYQIEITNITLDESKICLTYNRPSHYKQDGEAEFLSRVLKLVADTQIPSYQKYSPYGGLMELCLNFKQKSL